MLVIGDVLDIKLHGHAISIDMISPFSNKFLV
jgi:hypothetical protein